ncbi:hypothetical protein TNCV_4819901 [Trichonephila clavipes]|nr:hypothetical protein TNCV_4819901 [Trichonephila clavipes]
MGKKGDLSPCKKSEVKALVNAKLFSNRKISRRLTVSEASVRRIKKKNESGEELSLKRKKKCCRKPISPQAGRMVSKWRIIHFYARWSSMPYSSVYQKVFGRTKYPSVGLAGDEAHFWLNGYVNKQNCRIWREANPQVYVETPLHPEKLTVWCALWAGGILLQKR